MQLDNNQLQFNWITNRSPDFQLCFVRFSFARSFHWTRLEIKISDAIMIFSSAIFGDVKILSLPKRASLKSSVYAAFYLKSRVQLQISLSVKSIRDEIFIHTFYTFGLSLRLFSLVEFFSFISVKNWSNVFIQAPGKI